MLMRELGTCLVTFLRTEFLSLDRLGRQNELPLVSERRAVADYKTQFMITLEILVPARPESLSCSNIWLQWRVCISKQHIAA
jgi:hypothetical protein